MGFWQRRPQRRGCAATCESFCHSIDLRRALFPVPAVLPPCDTPRRAKRRISAPRTELARLPKTPTTSGRCHRGRLRLPAETAAHAWATYHRPEFGHDNLEHQWALGIMTGHHDQVRPILMGMGTVRQECIR